MRHYRFIFSLVVILLTSACGSKKDKTQPTQPIPDKQTAVTKTEPVKTAAEPLSAVVLEMKTGLRWREAPGKPWKALKIGDAIPAGEIKTAADGQATIRIGAFEKTLTGGEHIRVEADGNPKEIRAGSTSQKEKQAKKPANGPGALTVRDPDTGETRPLRLTRCSVRTTIDNGVSLTELDLTFFNDAPRQTEGVFKLVLPADAAPARVAMWTTPETLIEAEVVERRFARRVYETIKRQMLDPALMEWQDGNIFETRIFPIPANGPKRILIAYTEALPAINGTATYRLPLSSDLTRQFPLEQFSLDVNIASDRNITYASAPAWPEAAIQTTPNAVRVTMTKANFVPDKDFSLVWTRGSDNEIVASSYREKEGDDAYVLFSIETSSVQSGDDDSVRDIDALFLFDTSKSREGLLYKGQLEALRLALLELDPEDRFAVIGFDVSATLVTNGFQSPQPDAIRSVLDKLTTIVPLGATNMDALLDSIDSTLKDRQDAARKPIVALFGDGLATIGERASEKLIAKGNDVLSRHRARFFSVTLGNITDRTLLKALSQKHGGVAEIIGSGDDIGEAVYDLATLFKTPLLTGLKLDFGDSVQNLVPSELGAVRPGQEIFALGKIKKDGVIGGVLTDDQQGERPATVDIISKNDKNLFIPRLWARIKIDETLRLPQTLDLSKSIIQLSQKYGLITPYTSFLVLETEADYAKYGINRDLRFRFWEQAPYSIPPAGWPTADELKPALIITPEPQLDVSQTGVPTAKTTTETPAVEAKKITPPFSPVHPKARAASNPLFDNLNINAFRIGGQTARIEKQINSQEKHIYAMRPGGLPDGDATMAAVLSRLFMGVPRDELKTGVDYAIEKKGLPAWGNAGETVDWQYWYFGTLANFQMGGDYHKRWNNAFRDILIEKIVKDGDFAGSWDPVGNVNGLGRCGSTALGELNLEVYYRYSPIYRGGPDDQDEPRIEESARDDGLNDSIVLHDEFLPKIDSTTASVEAAPEVEFSNVELRVPAAPAEFPTGDVGLSDEEFESDGREEVISMDIDGGGMAGQFGHRAGGRRQAILRSGGSARSESVVDTSSRWLAQSQEDDGHWKAARWGAVNDPAADYIVTGLATLSFLGGGHTEKAGSYKNNVQKAVAWIISKQQPDGSYFPPDLSSTMSGMAHAICALAMSEASGMANIPTTKESAQKAIGYSCNIYQTRRDGRLFGWGNTPGAEPDTISTTWFIMQLRSAKGAGLRVPFDSLDGAFTYLNAVQVDISEQTEFEQELFSGDLAALDQMLIKPEYASDLKYQTMINLRRAFLLLQADRKIEAAEILKKEYSAMGRPDSLVHQIIETVKEISGPSAAAEILFEDAALNRFNAERARYLVVLLDDDPNAVSLIRERISADIDGGLMTRLLLARRFVEKGRTADAIPLFQEVFELSGGQMIYLDEYAAAGDAAGQSGVVDAYYLKLAKLDADNYRVAYINRLLNTGTVEDALTMIERDFSDIAKRTDILLRLKNIIASQSEASRFAADIPAVLERIYTLTGGNETIGVECVRAARSAGQTDRLARMIDQMAAQGFQTKAGIIEYVEYIASAQPETSLTLALNQFKTSRTRLLFALDQLDKSFGKIETADAGAIDYGVIREAVLVKLFALSGQSHDIGLRYAEACLNHGRIDEAKRFTEMMLRGGLTDDMTTDIYFQVLEKSNSSLNALLRAKSCAVEDNPSDDSARKALADWYIQIADPQSAIKELLGAFRKNPLDPAVGLQICSLAEKIGDWTSFEEAQLILLETTWESRHGDVWTPAADALRQYANRLETDGQPDAAVALRERLAYASVIDLWVQLTWDKGNDQDLRITEPGGLQCSYQNKTTALGGVLDHDDTDGFGPETYMIKRARDGEYIIYTDQFAGDGAVASTLTVTIRKGATDEQTKTYTVQTLKAKDRVEVCRLLFPLKGAN